MTLFKRPPDLDIGPGYLHRWYVIPRNRFLNIYLHHILRDDDDRAEHDHPWISLSFLLKGGLAEFSKGRFRIVPRFRPVFRLAKTSHRLVVLRPAWTLFITGPVVRDWGFHCPNGWVHWRKFTSGKNGEITGRGCDQ